MRRGRSVKVRVVCYEGYKAEETPRAFLLGERRIDVVRVLDRWLGEDHEYVKLDGSDGARYILRYDRNESNNLCLSYASVCYLLLHFEDECRFKRLPD